MTTPFDPIDTAVDALGRGEMVVVVDDESRENEGDLVMAADHAAGADVNFMARYGRGLICLAMTGQRLDALDIPPMVAEPEDPHQTDFGVSIDAKSATTGISAADRADTIRTAVDPGASPHDLVRPGHIFPLRAKEGGVFTRPGHTEAAVDLARLAGCRPAGVICEIMREDGTMARLPDLTTFADTHGLALIRIADLLQYRSRRDRPVTRVTETSLPTRHGEFTLVPFRDEVEERCHLALVMESDSSDDGRPRRATAAPLVRLHSQCLTGDALGSLRCDCGPQLEAALAQIADEGCGALIYLRQEGRGIGLANKLRAYALQDQGMDTVEANRALGFDDDDRDYGGAAQILRQLGLTRLRLLTNNPTKVKGLEQCGLDVVERIPLKTHAQRHNHGYLETKRRRLGHDL